MANLMNGGWQTVATWHIDHSFARPGCGGWIQARVQMNRVNNARSQLRVILDGNQNIQSRNNITWSIRVNGVNYSGSWNTGGATIDIRTARQMGSTFNVDYTAGRETINIENGNVTFPGTRWGWTAPFRTLGSHTLRRAASTIRVNTAQVTPPPPPPPPRTNWGRRWNGSSWINMTPRRWNGTSWVTCRARRWNGTSWVDIT